MNRLSSAIGMLWLASLALVAAGWISLVRSGHLLDIPGGQTIFVTGALLAAPMLATAMNRRHPDEWTGVLLGATVLLAALGACRAASLGGFTALAGPSALVTALLPAVLISRYPALQAPIRPQQVIAAAAGIAAAIAAIVSGTVLIRGTVPNPWWLSGHPASAGTTLNVLLAAYTAVVVCGAALTAALILRRYRAGTPNARASLRPLVLPALGWTISVTATALWTFLAGIRAPLTDVSGGNAGTAFGLLPAVLVGALAAGIAWLDLAVRRPGRTAGIGRAALPVVQAYLSRALADPSIRVAYPAAPEGIRFEDVEHWVDRDGQPVELSPDDPDRAITIIERDGVVIGLIEQDAATTSRPDAVELVATGAGLMMETERLTASANRDLETSRVFASRLLSAADEPRAVLRADLVKGPLAELDSVALALAAGASLADCLTEFAAVSVKVRVISHGVFPAELAMGGLAEALETVTSSRRYPAVVELTAYLAARDDPQATVLAADDVLRITTRCEPAPMVRDRVTALGGRVEPLGTQWAVDVPIADGID